MISGRRVKLGRDVCAILSLLNIGLKEIIRTGQDTR